MQPEQTDIPDARQQFVGRLAAGVAHDVANRLAVARLISEAFASRADLPAEDIAKLTVLADAIDEASVLMEQLSAVTGRRRGSAHVVQLDTVVADMLPLLRAALGGRTIHLSGSARAFADRAEVESTTLRLVLGCRRGRQEPPLEVSVTAEDRCATIAVGDAIAEFAPAQPGGVVLVLEDDGELRRAVQDALLGDSYEVIAVADVGTGTRVLSEGRVQLVVAGAGSCASSGLDLIERVRHGGVPVLVMSAGTDRTLLASVPAGVIILDPPYSESMLREGVRHALGVD